MDNMVIRGKISEVELAYIAGLFDGEGHVFITIKKSTNKMRTQVHVLRVGITNTYRDVIEWLYELFPTYLYKRIRHKDHPTWKPCFFWETSSGNAMDFLKIIYPYLRIKKEQAQLAIEFQTNWRDRRFNARRQIMKTSPEVLEKRQWYRDEISMLNKQKSPAETKRRNTPAKG